MKNLLNASQPAGGINISSVTSRLSALAGSSDYNASGGLYFATSSSSSSSATDGQRGSALQQMYGARLPRILAQRKKAKVKVKSVSNAALLVAGGAILYLLAKRK